LVPDVSCVELCGFGRIERVATVGSETKIPPVGFFLRKAGRPNLHENAARKYH
jgi:hypothetical protein